MREFGHVSVAAAEGSAPESEAVLAELWAGRRLRGPLFTVSGKQIEVVYPGRAAPGWGPDFRDAYLVLAGAPLQGDVELHLRTSGFAGHGHLADPAYDRLALHVVLTHDEPLPWTLTRSGRRVEILELAAQIIGQATRGGALALGAPLPCAGVEQLIGTAEARRRLRAMALRRLRASAERFRREAAALGAEQALYARLLEGLGYQQNRAPMRLLAARLPLAALLEGSAADPERRAERLAGLLIEQAAGLPWRLERLRPAASPFLRLRAGGALVARLWERGPAESALAGLDARGMVSLLGVPGGCGHGRAIELAVNAVLPYLASGGQEERAEDLLLVLPSPGRYGGLRHLYASLPPRSWQGAAGAQALIDLDRNYCRKGKCGACPMSSP
jgi:hypothetical protein